MDKAIALIVGALCGVGQFYVVRHSLKPLAENGELSLTKGVFLKVPIPLALLLGCAFINPRLLPFAGGAFCVCLIVTGIVNHLITLKKEG